MLIYHPAEDSNHCSYRLIRLLSKLPSESIPQATLFICDFYSLFPGQLKKIKGWPRKNSSAWKTVQSIPDEYEEVINARRVFYKLKEIQVASLLYLGAKEIVDISDATDRTVRLNKGLIPAKITGLLDEDEYGRSAWFSLITNELSRIDLYGKNGLKDKTGLMEFVYD